MLFCSRCASLDFGSLIERACDQTEVEPGNHDLPSHIGYQDVPFDDIKQAAAQGCQLCQMIQYGHTQVPSQWFGEEMRPKDDTPIMLSLILERCMPNRESVSAQCYALCAAVQAGTEVAEDSVTITIASNIGSSPYVAQKRALWNPDLWRSWMDNCCKTHTLCKAIKQIEHAPTRLIDVGSETIAPRLIESHRDCKNILRFRTAGATTCRCEPHANYHEHTTAISWEAMPTTFRDAIEVTRALGCEYLWIDCLCIIQDSEEDWSRECTFMGEVYAGALVTISSSQGTSVTDGIFEPMPWSDLACDIPITWPSTKEPDVLHIDFLHTLDNGRLHQS